MFTPFTTADRRSTSGGERIAALDIQRGIAILLILFFNLPTMGGPLAAHEGDPRLIGWSGPDQPIWWVMSIFLQDTQRGLLELIFGAGVCLALARTVAGDSDRAPLFAHLRRCIVLMLLGLVDIFGFLWLGDFLLVYGAAGLLLPLLRKLRAPLLLIIGSGFLLFTVQQGLSARAAMVEPPVAASTETAGAPMAVATSGTGVVQPAGAERIARLGAYPLYASWMIQQWREVVFRSGLILIFIMEAFFTMVVGMALFKLGIIQGDRSRPFYLRAMLLCYAVALPVRIAEAQSLLGSTTDLPLDLLHEGARLLMTVGHVCLINLILKTRIGTDLFAPLKPVGRFALSLYLMQSVVAMLILFPGFGLGLWGKLSWTGFAAYCLTSAMLQTALANLWATHFRLGPVEYLTRAIVHARPGRRGGVNRGMGA